MTIQNMYDAAIRAGYAIDSHCIDSSDIYKNFMFDDEKHRLNRIGDHVPDGSVWIGRYLGSQDNPFPSRWTALGVCAGYAEAADAPTYFPLAQ